MVLRFLRGRVLRHIIAACLKKAGEAAVCVAKATRQEDDGATGNHHGPGWSGGNNGGPMRGRGGVDPPRPP